MTDVPTPLPQLSSKLPWHCGPRVARQPQGYPPVGVQATHGLSYLEVSSSNVATHAQGRGTLARDVGKRQLEEAVPGQTQRPAKGRQG